MVFVRAKLLSPSPSPGGLVLKLCREMLFICVGCWLGIRSSQQLRIPFFPSYSCSADGQILINTGSRNLEAFLFSSGMTLHTDLEYEQIQGWCSGLYNTISRRGHSQSSGCRWWHKLYSWVQQWCLVSLGVWEMEMKRERVGREGVG